MNEQKLLKEYPFLAAPDLWGNPMDGYTVLDDLPEGWHLLVLQLAEDIKEVGYPDNFHFVQAKEKYGTLRLYPSGATEEICNLLDIYEIMSANICCVCGKPDVPMCNTAWISPFCEECFNKANYSDVADENSTIRSTISISTYADGKWESKETDISTFVNRYREMYRRYKE